MNKKVRLMRNSCIGLLLELTACNEPMPIHILGQVLAPTSDAGPMLPAGDLHVHYQLSQNFTTGATPKLDIWTQTNQKGEIDDTRWVRFSDGADVGMELKSWSARVSLLFSPATDGDWSPGGEPERPPTDGNNSDLVRRDRFLLSTPIISLGVAAYALQQNMTSPATVDEEIANNEIQREALIWHQCGIKIQPVLYRQVDTQKLKVPYKPKNNADLDALRKTTDPTYIDVIVSGNWDATSALGADYAFTNYPSDPPLGCVLAAHAVGKRNLLAHEMGHYFNLAHVDRGEPDWFDGAGNGCQTNSNLMFYHVCEDNWILTPGQCARARWAIEHSKNLLIIRR